MAAGGGAMQGSSRAQLGGCADCHHRCCCCCWCDVFLQASASSAAEGLQATQREAERQTSATAAAALKTEVRDTCKHRAWLVALACKGCHTRAVWQMPATDKTVGGLNF